MPGRQRQQDRFVSTPIGILAFWRVRFWHLHVPHIVVCLEDLWEPRPNDLMSTNLAILTGGLVLPVSAEWVPQQLRLLYFDHLSTSLMIHWQIHLSVLLDWSNAKTLDLHQKT